MTPSLVLFYFFEKKILVPQVPRSAIHSLVAPSKIELTTGERSHTRTNQLACVKIWLK